MGNQWLYFLLCVSLAYGLHIPVSKRYANTTVDTRFTYEPIKTGYVAFGDSYAAGMGAGSTGSGGCRIGASSYPSQLHTWVDSLQPGVDYQNLPCSGAVVTEVLAGGDKSQIDKWSSPSKADRATLSIGGNDIGFYNVLTACVLRLEQNFAGKCNEQVAEAYDIMNSQEFQNNIDNALRQMIAKSGRSEFRIVQTGYPRFFNDKTSSCDYTTFYFWQPGHHGIHHGGNWAYLERPLRAKLNKLVDDLNTKLESIGKNVNKDFSQPRVLFADPNPAFEGHRFCENGITEPDSSNPDNWMFLASWPDHSAPGAVAAPLDASSGPSLSGMSIPDSTTCGTTHDWAELMLCGMAKAGLVQTTSSGISLVPTIELPDATNISTSEISWWKPTNWAKTFHPRSIGYLGYRDLVRSTW